MGICDSTFFWIKVEKGSKTKYEYADFAFEHLDIKAKRYNISSWDVNLAGNFTIAIL